MSCDSNERHTPDVANPAEDLIAHSLKKGEEQANIPPKKIAQHHTAADIHAPASQNGDGYPPSGLQGDDVSPLAIKNQSTFSTEPFAFIFLNWSRRSEDGTPYALRLCRHKTEIGIPAKRIKNYRLFYFGVNAAVKKFRVE